MEALDNYTQHEFKARLHDQIASMLVNPLAEPQENPSAVLLGGQSGAGKSTLHVVFKDKLNGNVLVVNGDEYRRHHPHFLEIQERYGIDAPAHTAKWSGAMVEALVGALSDEGYNLIVEGTLRTSTVPMKTAALLKSKGYGVQLALMAVKPEISLVSCQIRYESMRLAGTTPRAVDPEHHAKIVQDIVGNLATLESSDLFTDVSLFNRSGACLFTAKCPTAGNPASLVLHDIMYGEWTDEEAAHYADLQKQLLALQES